MAHKHSVYDGDTHFKIDELTRHVKNESEIKSMLVQYDHNSERFTFEVPRYVDGHDLSLCNAVRVHYINIDKSKRTENRGVYEVTDLQICPDDDEIVICSWLISNNATQLVGALYFVVQFACIEDNEVVYSWNTARYTGVVITDGIYNGDDIEREYADILQVWYEKLFEMTGGNIDLNSGDAVKFWVGSSAEFEQVKDELPKDCVVFLTDAPVTAEGAPSGNGIAYTENGDEGGHVFNFSNTTGFGLYDEKGKGHFKLWSQPNSNGDYACCLVPSKNEFMSLGASTRKYDRVFATRFEGSALSADRITPPIIDVNANTYQINQLQAGIYTVLIDAKTCLWSETICITPRVLENGDNVIGTHVEFVTDGARGGTLRTYGEGAYNIISVVKIASFSMAVD